MTSDAAVLREVGTELARAGLRASLLVRRLGTGEEIGVGAEETWPLASLAKLPLALAVLAALRGPDGPAPADPVRLRPGGARVGASVGAGQFEHPATVSALDALYLAVSLSDNVAADALLELVPWPAATRLLGALGLHDTRLVTAFGDLADTPAEQLGERPELGHVVAAAAGLGAGGHRLPVLDPSRTNAGTARDLAGLLAAVWEPRDTVLHPDDARHLRRLLRANVHRQRLWPELASPASAWASKTGTLLHLRHEAGVVEHDDGDRLAVVVMTASSTPAVTQPYAEFTMARAARRLHDHLRR